jgi:mannosyltransferase OCH1-like enzyme
MIPQKIHFCWISKDPYPDLIKKCLNSWELLLPSYEIVLWDYDKAVALNNDWVNQAIQSKKFAFASDYVRFYALYNEGGIYLDSDVEVLKSMDELLNQKSFIGFESENYLEAAIIGSMPNQTWLNKCLKYYESRLFIKEDEQFDLKPLPSILTPILSNHLNLDLNDTNEVQTFPDITIYPKEYFCPKSTKTYQVFLTSNSFTIHHFKSSWYDSKGKLKKWIKHFIPKWFLLFLYSFNSKK